MIRALPIFPELSRSLKSPCLVRGIDCDYSRNDPSTPDFSRTLPKHKNTVFGVFAYIFRTKESIATIPETDPSISDFRQTSDRLSASKKISKREDAWPQATPLAAKLPLGSEAARGAAQPPPPASQS
ncbi:hypothetical protein NQ317_006958 [Molorchus minor]|uniref:Uncharacterized protein n=1 Tax=Molorchus minor TaxID=1323400 RepID=A0ABQ9JVM9_9CUCU|nr:hypothetical protein NQ317_006958 [Molorchus minor]